MPAPAYMPRTLGDDRPSEVVALASTARQGKLVLYVGAGLSAAPPSNGPLGNAVAELLIPFVAHSLSEPVEDLNGLTLERLADRVEAKGGAALAHLRRAATQTFDFAGMEPNYGHRVVALLMREGLARVLSANWDRAIERAGSRISAEIRPVTCAHELHQVSIGVPLLKVHGCCSNPDSLRITTKDVDDAEAWAAAEVVTALTNGTAVFIGLGTVGEYVRDPIVDLLKQWAGFGQAVRVVAPELPASWLTILGELADGSAIESYSNDFLDDLLREIVADCLTRVALRAHNLAGRETWALPIVVGVSRLQSLFNAVGAEPVLGWWRGGVIDTKSGRPFVTAPEGEDALLAVSYLVGCSDSARVEGRGSRLVLATPEAHLEIISRPGAVYADVEAIAIENARTRWQSGTYPDGRETVFVVVGAMGRFPSAAGVADIGAGTLDPVDIGSGPGPVRLISASEVIEGRYGR